VPHPHASAMSVACRCRQSSKTTSAPKRSINCFLGNMSPRAIIAGLLHLHYDDADRHDLRCRVGTMTAYCGLNHRRSESAFHGISQKQTRSAHVAPGAAGTPASPE
jgi:hypothetical protein